MNTVVDVVATAIGYDQPRDGLLGSGFSRMLAYQRAGDICKALGVPTDLDADKLRRFCAGEVTHIGPKS